MGGHWYMPILISTLQELKCLKNDWLQPTPSGATCDTPIAESTLRWGCWALYGKIVPCNPLQGWISGRGLVPLVMCPHQTNIDLPPTNQECLWWSQGHFAGIGEVHHKGSYWQCLLVEMTEQHCKGKCHHTETVALAWWCQLCMAEKCQYGIPFQRQSYAAYLGWHQNHFVSRIYGTGQTKQSQYIEHIW